MSFTFDARRRATLTAVVDTFVASVPRDDDPTGFWAEEFLAPYNKFKEAGWDVVVATPGAEPVAEGGYGAALLLDGAVLLDRPAVTGGMVWHDGRMTLPQDPGLGAFAWDPGVGP